MFAYVYQTINELKRNLEHVRGVDQDSINLITLLSFIILFKRDSLFSLSPPLQHNLKSSQLHKAQTITRKLQSNLVSPK